MAHYIINGRTQLEIDKAVEDDQKLIVRTIRNKHLEETDWWELPSQIMTEERTAYRQALRDVTEQVGFPHNVIWPVKPE